MFVRPCSEGLGCTEHNSILTCQITCAMFLGLGEAFSNTSVYIALEEVDHNLLGVDWDTLEPEAVAYESEKRQPFPKVFLITFVRKCSLVTSLNEQWRHETILIEMQGWVK